MCGAPFSWTNTRSAGSSLTSVPVGARMIEMNVRQQHRRHVAHRDAGRGQRRPQPRQRARRPGIDQRDAARAVDDGRRDDARQLHEVEIEIGETGCESDHVRRDRTNASTPATARTTSRASPRWPIHRSIVSQLYPSSVAHGPERRRPRDRARGVEKKEPAPRQRARAGQHGADDAEAGDEARDEDGLRAVPREEGIELRQTRLGDAEDPAVALDEHASAVAADDKPDVVAEHGPRNGDDDNVGSERWPKRASTAPARRMVSPGTGTPAFSSRTPKKTTKYP